MRKQTRLAIALLLPFLAGGVQWLLWEGWIKPYVWFLFFPAAFFSAWLGGLRGGLAATVISALIVWYFYIPPQFSFVLDESASGASIALFVLMGGLFAWVFERLEQARQRTDEAFRATEAATEKITRLYEKTLELDALKSQFFANVSHELRTPLTLLIAPLEHRLKQLQNAGASNDLTREKHETEMMLRNARLLYRHVADILDAAKLEGGGMTISWSKIDLAPLVRTIASHFEPLAHDRQITYRIDTPDHFPVECDGEKLQRVLLNLLSNAFKFTPDGGRIDINLTQENGRALLAVSDSGPGIHADLRGAIFERFWQVEGGTHRRHGGTGLGLAIVKEFASMHGGRVSVDDAPGGGARFEVELPLNAPAGTALVEPIGLDVLIDRQTVEALAPLPAEPAIPVPEAQIGAALPLVLVVEDNPDMNAFVVANLRPRYRVISAGNGQQGLDLALMQRPDLILCDIMMPLISGDELVAHLRRHPETAETPIVILTAKADENMRIKLLQSGVQDYLNKPFSVDELLARVDSLTADRQRAREKLQASETRFEATFEQAAVGIAHVAPDGHWLRINQRFCDIVGYTQDELLPRKFQDITHPDDLQTDLGLLKRVLSKEIDTYRIDKRYFRKSGEIVWVNLSVALVRKPDGTPDYFISVVQDISARKAAEAALRESEANLREANRLAKLGHWRWDVEHDTHQWSAEIYEIYGRDPHLPPATYPEVSTYFTPAAWTTLSLAVASAIKTGEPYACDAEVVRPDGEQRWITARGVARRDEQGVVIELHGTVQDITERKMASEELRRRNEALELFERASIDRELEMIDLKRQVNRLSAAQGHLPPFDLSFADAVSLPAPANTDTTGAHG